MKKIAAMVIWIMLQPGVAGASDWDMDRDGIGGDGGTFETRSEKKLRDRLEGRFNREPDSRITITPVTGEMDCDGTNIFTVERDGVRYRCHESVNCKVTCEER